MKDDRNPPPMAAQTSPNPAGPPALPPGPLQPGALQQVPALPIDYAGQLPPARPPLPVLDLWLAVRVWSFGIVVMAIAVLIVPRLEVVFKDFKTELPGITKWILQFSRTVASSWFVAMPLLTAIFGGLPFVLTAIARAGANNHADYKNRLRWLNLVVLLIGTLFTLVFVLALFLPVIRLVDSVSAGSRK